MHACQLAEKKVVQPIKREFCGRWCHTCLVSLKVTGLRNVRGVIRKFAENSYHFYII